MKLLYSDRMKKRRKCSISNPPLYSHEIKSGPWWHPLCWTKI